MSKVEQCKIPKCRGLWSDLPWPEAEERGSISTKQFQALSGSTAALHRNMRPKPVRHAATTYSVSPVQRAFVFQQSLKRCEHREGNIIFKAIMNSDMGEDSRTLHDGRRKKASTKPTSKHGRRIEMSIRTAFLKWVLFHFNFSKRLWILVLEDLIFCIRIRPTDHKGKFKNFVIFFPFINTYFFNF